MSETHGFASGQRGFVLIFALVILVTLTLLGFIASRTAVIEMTVSGNERIQRETFSLADGGADAAIRIFQENMDCATGFTIPQGNNIGAIWFNPSNTLANAFIDAVGKDESMNYTQALPATIIPNDLPPVRDAGANPEILRHFCIGGEGINTQAGSANGCDPQAADAGAPHTNILYNPDPDGTGPSHSPGDSANSTGAGSSMAGTMTDVDIYSQHVAYQGAQRTVTKEAIILIRWAQKNDGGVNDCASGPWGKPAAPAPQINE